MTSPPRLPGPLSTEIVGLAMAATAHTVHVVRDIEWHASPGPPRVLCGVAVSSPPHSWFALSGCKRCCRRGLADGLVDIIDTDGRRVVLSDVLDGIVRDD